MADEPVQNPRTEVDDQTLGRILRCEPMTIRRYVRIGVIKREKNKKFALFQSIGAVVEYLRGMAGSQGSGDAIKAGAALKNAQRQLAEVKLAKLNGELLSMPEIEAIWGDLAAATKWLFLTLPVRIRASLTKVTAEDEATIAGLCTSMLREVAFSGQLQLPGKNLDDARDDDDEEEDQTEPVIREGFDGSNDKSD